MPRDSEHGSRPSHTISHPVQRSHTLHRAGTTLTRAGSNAARGLSNFFGVSKESRAIWSEKFQQRVTQQKLGVTLPDEKEMLTTLSRRLSWKRAIRTGNRHRGHSLSPEVSCPTSNMIELDDEVFLSPNNNSRGSEQSLIYDPIEALKCYRRMIEIARVKEQKTPLTSTDSSEWFGVNTLVRVGTNDKSQEQMRTPTSLARDHNIKVQLESLPEFTPWFIYLITLVQIIFMCFMLWSFGGVHSVGLSPYLQYHNKTPTLKSSKDMVVRVVHPNLWLGPDEHFLIKFGAKFSPCMREDHLINIGYTTKYSKEAADEFVCCQFQSVNRNWVGYTPRDQCLHVHFGKVLSTANCTVFTDKEPMYTHKFRPCCSNITGGCILTSQENCLFMKGLWQENKETCKQVNCLAQICGMSGMDNKSPNTPYIASANQGYRLITALFVHAGIIHLLLNVVAQLVLGTQIERTAGWFRVLLIYVTSGVGGNLLSSIFVPYSPTCGADGPVYGLLGVLLVELLQSWQVVDNPGTELCKLMFVIFISLLVGTLPYIDNFAHIGGFIFGILSAYLFLPYITFGKLDAGRKVCQIVMAFLLIAFVFIVCFVAFYIVQRTEWCRNCMYLNCVPYTKHMCKDNNL